MAMVVFGFRDEYLSLSWSPLAQLSIAYDSRANRVGIFRRSLLHTLDILRSYGLRSKRQCVLVSLRTRIPYRTGTADWVR